MSALGAISPASLALDKTANKGIVNFVSDGLNLSTSEYLAILNEISSKKAQKNYW